jgi:hypothetical protein
MFLTSKRAGRSVTIIFPLKIPYSTPGDIDQSPDLMSIASQIVKSRPPKHSASVEHHQYSYCGAIRAHPIIHVGCDGPLKLNRDRAVL